MALERTLLSPNTSLSSSLTPKLSFPKRLSNIKLHSTRRLCKCSYEYTTTGHVTATNNNNNGGGAQYPRPTEVEWKKELCNMVQLMGIVAMPVQVKHLPSGKALAWSRIAVKRSQTETLWINLTFWEELAHIASQHVEKGQQIYVTGRLVSDTTEDGEGKQQTFYKVVVQQLNFVERSFPSGGMNNGDSNSMPPEKKPNINRTGSMEELWQAFFANPSEWWDNRKTKAAFLHEDPQDKLFWTIGQHLAINHMPLISLHHGYSE